MIYVSHIESYVPWRMTKHIQQIELFFTVLHSVVCLGLFS